MASGLSLCPHRPCSCLSEYFGFWWIDAFIYMCVCPLYSLCFHGHFCVYISSKTLIFTSMLTFFYRAFIINVSASLFPPFYFGIHEFIPTHISSTQAVHLFNIYAYSPHPYFLNSPSFCSVFPCTLHLPHRLDWLGK